MIASDPKIAANLDPESSRNLLFFAVEGVTAASDALRRSLSEGMSRPKGPICCKKTLEDIAGDFDVQVPDRPSPPLADSC